MHVDFEVFVAQRVFLGERFGCRPLPALLLVRADPGIAERRNLDDHLFPAVLLERRPHGPGDLGRIFQMRCLHRRRAGERVRIGDETAGLLRLLPVARDRGPKLIRGVKDGRCRRNVVAAVIHGVARGRGGVLLVLQQVGQRL
jgi:hypothetical protein